MSWFLLVLLIILGILLAEHIYVMWIQYKRTRRHEDKAELDITPEHYYTKEYGYFINRSAIK